MARPRQERPRTRERLVETARRLFLEQGFDATGVAQILEQSAVNSGSLYYFFKTKEDLLLAVLESYLELLGPSVIDPAFKKSPDPVERIFLVLGRYREMLVLSGCRSGCPIGNLALEMSERSERVRGAVVQNFENWRQAIRDCLEAAGERLPRELDREALATLVLTTMEGGVMQARAHRSLAPFDHAVAALRDYFDRLLAAA